MKNPNQLLFYPNSSFFILFLLVWAGFFSGCASKNARERSIAHKLEEYKKSQSELRSLKSRLRVAQEDRSSQKEQLENLSENHQQLKKQNKRLKRSIDSLKLSYNLWKDSLETERIRLNDSLSFKNESLKKIILRSDSLQSLAKYFKKKNAFLNNKLQDTVMVFRESFLASEKKVQQEKIELISEIESLKKELIRAELSIKKMTSVSENQEAQKTQMPKLSDSLVKQD